MKLFFTLFIERSQTPACNVCSTTVMGLILGSISQYVKGDLFYPMVKLNAPKMFRRSIPSRQKNPEVVEMQISI